MKKYERTENRKPVQTLRQKSGAEVIFEFFCDRLKRREINFSEKRRPRIFLNRNIQGHLNRRNYHCRDIHVNRVKRGAETPENKRGQECGGDLHGENKRRCSPDVYRQIAADKSFQRLHGA